MSQHDMILDNQAGAAFRSDLNSALAALVSLSSGAQAPTVTYANMLWADTLSGFLKQRDNSNTSWISVYPLSGIQNILDPYLFYKSDKSSPAFIKTGNGTASIKAGTILKVAQQVFNFNSNTAITMPTLTSGTDYAIYVCSDGTVRADSNFTSPTGYTTLNSLKIGGFHYAPGGNATAQAGGNTTPQINEYSFYDPQWKPVALDPRGMSCINGAFWRDIYFFNNNPDVNGTSKYNQIIADGASPPKIPALLGGNGSTTLTTFTWFEAARIAACYGKQLITLEQQIISSFGTTEASSVGTDQGSTVWNAAYVSKFGINQCSGVMWTWLADRGGAYNTAGWSADTNGFGSSYNAPNAALGGGNWGNGLHSGSGCSAWGDAASASASHIGASFGCGHLNLAR